MPRQRKKENTAFPPRWRVKHGAYYYRVPPGCEVLWDGKREFRLGSSLLEASTTWAQRVGGQKDVRTIGALLDRYALEELPRKAAKTQGNHTQYIARLRTVFGTMPLLSIRPQHIYLYADKRRAKRTGAKATATAHAELAVLSHAFTKAVEWGLIDQHPFLRQVRLQGNPPRDRYIEDWEITEALALPSKRSRGSVLAVQAAIRLIMLTPLRRADYLQLRMSDIREDGIHVRTSKTGKPMIYAWSDELRNAVEMAKAARPVDLSPWLFCNRRGESYYDPETGEASGWDSMTQRFMERLLSETKISLRFTLHDVRAKCGSDAESIERARALLAHADSKMTVRAYRRAPEVVTPLR